MSSVLGNKIKLSVFGESHGEAIGCVIDGLPSGVRLDMDRILLDMKRRAPGRDKTATPRKENDAPKILSGVLNGVTTGAPLAMIIENTNTKSGDYGNVMTTPRPSHSDYPAFVKFGGNNDVRGGGHFSGRLTAPIVFAGSVAKQILAEKGIRVAAHISRIGNVYDTPFNKLDIDDEIINSLQEDVFPTISTEKEIEMRAVIEDARLKSDSIGGAVECAVTGLPAGVGGNMFDTVEGKISYAVFGIPAVKGIEFGIGFNFAGEYASHVNDEYEVKNGKVCLASNNNGGVLGGITTSAPIVFNTVIKPTPSIAQPQNSINLQTMENETLVINGRHDPCIVPRAVPVIECVTAFTILDLI